MGKHVGWAKCIEPKKNEGNRGTTLTGGAGKAKLKYYDVKTIRQMNTTKLEKITESN